MQQWGAFMLDVSFSKLLCSNFIFHMSLLNSRFIFFMCLQKLSLEEKIDMLICNLFKIIHNIWFQQFNRNGIFLFAITSEIMCEHSGNLHCMMPSYKGVHLGLVRTRMNYACVRLVIFQTQTKLLLQLPNTLQALVFLL